METYQMLFNGTSAKTEKRNGHLSRDQREPSPLIYGYYDDGSLMWDSNKGIAHIAYSPQGYPVRVQFRKGHTTEYVYTADGQRIRTIHRTAVPNISLAMGDTLSMTAANTLSADTTDYFKDLVFEGGELKKYFFDGGYCTFTSAAGQPTFHYFTRDHQGNNRAVVRQDGTIEQIRHYYPLGGIYADAGTNDGLQKYKYNGKELDRMHGLNFYDYGARQYDPILGRFTQVDPMCERYYNFHPYAYCMNNPINSIDIEGKYLYYLTKQSDGTQQAYIYQQRNGTYGFYNNNNEMVDLYSGKLLSALEKIKQGDVGKSLVSFLENSERNVFIRSTIEDEGSTTYDSKNKNIIVAWDPENYSFAQNEYGVKNTPTFVSLAHELFHSQNMVLGTADYSPWIMYKGKLIPMEEYNASISENMIRAEHHLLQRTHYIDNYGLSSIPYQLSGISTLLNHQQTLWGNPYYIYW